MIPSRVLLLILKVIPIIVGFIITSIGFKSSQPLLMVIGLFISGLCFILFIKKFQLKLIALLITFAIVPLVAVAWSLVHQFDVENLKTVTYALNQVSQKNAQQIDAWLAQKEANLDIIAKSVQNEHNLNQTSLKNIIDGIKTSSGDYEEIFICNTSGTILYSTGRENGNSIKIDGYMLNDKSICISDKSLTEGKPLITISKTYKNNISSFIVGSRVNIANAVKFGKEELSIIKNSGLTSMINTFVINKDGYLY